MADGGTKVSDDVERMLARDAELQEALEEFQKRLFSDKQAAKLRIPPLLNQRRKEHSIPNGAFSCQPTFEQVYLYQLAPEDVAATGTVGGKGIIKLTDNQRDYVRDENPRGILVAAGLRALDQLRTNGVDLGHIVRFVRFSPTQIIVDWFRGKPLRILVMYASAIAGSEDLEQLRRSGEMTVKWDPEADGGRGQHVWIDKKGKTLIPRTAWQPADME